MSYYPQGFDVAVVNRGKLGQRIDWPVVGEAKEVDFCAIRLLDGLHPDADAEYNWAGAEAISLPHVGYQAVYPWLDPVKQAVELAAMVKDGPYRAAGDFERDGGLKSAEYRIFARRYINEFEQRAGREMVIYTSPWFGSEYLRGEFSNRPLWIANPYSKTPTLPKGWKSWVIWQYTWVKSFKGIADTTVDGDYFNGTLEQLQEFFGVEKSVEPELSLLQRVERLEAQARDHGWTL